MASFLNQNFDDSEDEEDFNPGAEVDSGSERGENDSEIEQAPAKSSKTNGERRRREEEQNESDGDEEQTAESPRRRDRDDAVDGEDEAAESDGEGGNAEEVERDEEDEDDEDDEENEEEEVMVGAQVVWLPTEPNMHCRADHANEEDAIAGYSSLMPKLRSTTRRKRRMRETRMILWTTEHILTTSRICLQAPKPMTVDTGNWTDNTS